MPPNTTETATALQSIALHIGAHKTASSHLQKVLYNNRKLMSAEGIRCYGPGYLRMRGRNLAAMFGLSWSDSPLPRRLAQDQLAFLAKSHKRLIFSEENFVGVLTDKAGRVGLPLYPSAVDRVGELVAAWAPMKPQLFVAVRNPATFMASAYSQTLYGSVHIGPRTFRARNDWRLIDWADYIGKLRGIDGVGEIIVWRQEDYAQVYRHVLRRLLRGGVAGKLRPVRERVHQGLSAAAVRQTLAWAQEGETDKLAIRARSAFPISADNPAFTLYAQSTLADATQIYADQMARIDAMKRVTVLHPPDAQLATAAKG